MKKISVKDLEIGMFVEELAVSWLETPYPFQGLLISSQEDIDELANYCQYLYVSSKENMKKVFVKDLKNGMFV